MKRFAIVNAKGGTGKTTCVVNLAAALGAAGEPVLVLDLDPQGSASDGLGVLHPMDPGYDLRDVVDGTAGPDVMSALVRETSVPNVWVVPASPRLEGLSMRDIEGAGSGRVLYLRNALETLHRNAANWSYMLMDTAPTVGPAQIAALAAATDALIPLNPSPAALPGLQTAREAITRVRRGANPALELSGVMLCRVRRTRLAQDIRDQLQRALPGLVFRTTIRESVRVEEAHGWCRPVTEYDAQADVSRDFHALAAELVARTQPEQGPARVEVVSAVEEVEDGVA